VNGEPSFWHRSSWTFWIPWEYWIQQTHRHTAFSTTAFANLAILAVHGMPASGSLEHARNLGSGLAKLPPVVVSLRIHRRHAALPRLRRFDGVAGPGEIAA
jgi:hypothetical protein